MRPASAFRTVFVALLPVALAACQTTFGTSAVAAGSAAAASTVVGGAGSSTLTMLAGAGGHEFSFSPSSLTVSAGTPVTITLTNQGTVEHDLVVTPLNVSLRAVNGKSASQTYTFSQRGTYQVICDLPGHQDAGMVGTLIVQ